MATHITQTDDDSLAITTLRVEGEMLLDDALLLERIINDVRERLRNKVVLDLADLDFLDSDSAAVIRRFSNEKDVEIEGIGAFLQSAINLAERR